MEIFGCALSLAETVSLSGQKAALFSWKGATLTLGGSSPAIQYESSETVMPSYLNLHDALEARRHAALQASTAKARGGSARGGQSPGAQGPRILVAGPTDAGKSTLCRILLNYAVRCGWQPLFADLDMGQGSLTAPGCLAAAAIEAPIAPGADLATDSPLAFFCGRTSPGEAPELVRHLTERLAEAADARAAKDVHAAASGAVINACGWVEEGGFDLLLHACRTFRCDVAVVLGSDRLHSQLKQALQKLQEEEETRPPTASEKNANPAADGAKSAVTPTPSLPKLPKVSLVNFPRSGGAVMRSREWRAAARASRVGHYFYGPQRELAPASQTASCADLKVWRVGAASRAPSTALPLGARSVFDPLKLVPVENWGELRCTLLGVSHAPTADLLLAAPVAGFIYVQEVDEAKGTVTYLAPRSGNLPGSLLLAGAFKVYFD